MKQIEINNPDLLEILDKVPALFDIPDFDKWMHLHGKAEECEEHTSQEYLEKMLKKPQGVPMTQGGADGFPDHTCSYEFKAWGDRIPSIEKKAPAEFRKAVFDIIEQTQGPLMQWFGTRNPALANAYPENGYISWHNNANASGYNLIFTWSETGDGEFEYIDPISKELVIIHDKPGWQAKAGYFGSWEEKDRIIWHTARTRCKRITLSWIFDITDTAFDMQQEAIEDISSF